MWYLSFSEVMKLQLKIGWGVFSFPVCFLFPEGYLEDGHITRSKVQVPRVRAHQHDLDRTKDRGKAPRWMRTKKRNDVHILALWNATCHGTLQQLEQMHTKRQDSNVQRLLGSMLPFLVWWERFYLLSSKLKKFNKLDLFDQKRNFLEICRLQDLEEWLRHWDRASWTTDEKFRKVSAVRPVSCLCVRNAVVNWTKVRSWELYVRWEGRTPWDG